MRRIRLIAEYEGTAYVGWQTQPNGIAVQQKIEEAIENVTGTRSALHGSGRTDSGVHALAQVAHFDTTARMPADKFAFALNTFLPGDIRILYSDEVPDTFHSRFCAKRKHYRYSIQTGPHADVFLRRTALHVHAPLDFDVLQNAASEYLGEHDFRAFMSTGSTMENTVRSIYFSEWTMDGNLLHYDVCGNGFLYNMVRIMVGTMLEINAGKLPKDSIRNAFSTPERSLAGATAPAHGLTLLRVIYPDFDTKEILGRP
ncbi:MAG: tRNA pseudouridine(38-40) synthase TruA [Clostridia bacterium]|nr:tRNA pseudouridine(38-40) synthase TruA [Clostridia bacterium]